jgi:hypothetical protein
VEDECVCECEERSGSQTCERAGSQADRVVVQCGVVERATTHFLSISRASLEWPTSSNAPVASVPAVSSTTSSPPGCWSRNSEMSYLQVCPNDGANSDMDTQAQVCV